MSTKLRLLIIEDREDDALLTLLALRRSDYDVVWERVETAEGLEDALIMRGPWDLVISDWSMPRFDGLDALRIVRGFGFDVPLLMVSGTIGEEHAVAAMRAGASDFIVKGQLTRLVPAIERELRDAGERAARRRAESALRVSEAETRMARELAEARAVMLAALERERTELARLNLELEAARTQATRESSFKSKFLASMSHELRTPLNAIIGFSELLDLEASPTLSAVHREYVQNVLGSGEHLLTLINDVLDISKIEAGRMELRLAWHPIASVVDAVRGSTSSLAAKRELAFEVNVPSALPPVYIDAVRVKQVLLNLLSNAIKFTDVGGVVSMTVHVDATTMYIDVADTGIGISRDDLPRLFREFEQIHTGAMSAGGTGLGLALTRKLVELHGGRIRVASERGRGSTFTVELPLLRGAGAVSIPPSSDKSSPAASLILVVEDDSKAADLLASHLRSAGLQVAHAFDADSAIEQALALRPAAITVDLLLPGVDGWATLSKLKADPVTASIPVVVISVVDEPNRGLVLGAADHLVKPVSREALLRALENVGVTCARPLTPGARNP